MQRCHGFSLLEMLVVLLIVGLFSALGVASLDAGQAPMHQALAQLANEARTQAALARHSGQVLGMRWNGRQPEFVRWQSERGQPSWRLESSRAVSWPAGLQPDWPVSAAPQVMFTPAGLARPVSVTWHWAEGRQRWQWRADNTLRIATQP
ncbi:prepilin-type N-terminal cleavage/methylation domain-containing protein [Pseudomonas mucidolens]|uniref:General secretion pathway protein H n=1 Tax=Pseudomonas mucidolens TaxID=46679 RepID=A0A1H2MTT8_9PSED|nr:prepilin-type N-terminal cleavage/methylation domain-containing protein [Pseudomonas mucidolens]SDU96713.1 general secretion pathway protein H [Pseudomonas mucidolens]SQH33220.1 general secretion pathway protein H [Pseudomonas mucidolens]